MQQCQYALPDPTNYRRYVPISFFSLLANKIKTRFTTQNHVLNDSSQASWLSVGQSRATELTQTCSKVIYEPEINIVFKFLGVLTPIF